MDYIPPYISFVPSKSKMDYIPPNISFVPSKSPFLSANHFLKNKRDGGQQSKAPNKFLVYRACIAAELSARKIKIGDASEISRFAGYHWKMLSEQHKEAYKKISLEVKRLYLIRIPNTQFEEYNQNMSNPQGYYQEMFNFQGYHRNESYQNLSHQE
ncbi:8147_t:CDS:1 [Ambispora leptoticha]|uniref:8147_t:CDS:1 n=1 Tax=Ambispora leptoticha TaxID=144679 RepID=A0A9N9AQ43_9GLOM|nr:8147_t:CDS:1 [Ambispora leptoticha]